MLIEEITLRNILSFGPDTKPLKMEPLNVLIGPNGSGKSNFIDALSILQAAPRDIAEPVRRGGGIQDWLWKGGEQLATARIGAVVRVADNAPALLHALSFTEQGAAFLLTAEGIDYTEPQNSPPATAPEFSAIGRSDDGLTIREEQKATLLYGQKDGHGVIRDPFSFLNSPHSRENKRIDSDQSILSQRKDPERYSEITALSEAYPRIRIYREWSSGRSSGIRQAQKADRISPFLDEDMLNLALVLSRIAPKDKRALEERIALLYEGIDGYHVEILPGGYLQLYLYEGQQAIPSTRLSDGTLRYLCLLAILCNPSPPPLICIEEPELGLHPDLLGTIAELLIEASERTQIVVTTHSDILVERFSDTPESVVVCEKHNGATTMERLDPDEMEKWLKDYSLGELWIDGQLGGNRW